MPPYKSVEATKLSPECVIFCTENADAACPEATASAAAPPSIAATRCSNTSLVGFVDPGVNIS